MADEDTGYAAEVIDVIGNTGMHGDSQPDPVPCVLEGRDKGRIITRNCVGPVRLGDIMMLIETSREAKKLTTR